MKLVFSKGLNYLYLGAGHFRESIADLFVLRLTLIYSAAGLLLNIVCWFFATALRNSIGEELAVLHYNVTFGIDRIGDASGLYMLPLAGLGLLLLNILLAAFVQKKSERVLIHILLGMAVLGNGILLLGLYSAYIVNFS